MKKSAIKMLVTSTVLVSTIIFSGSSLLAQRRSQQNEKIRYEEKNQSKRLREYNRNERYNQSDYRSKNDQQRNQNGKKYSKINSEKYKNGNRYGHAKPITADHARCNGKNHHYVDRDFHNNREVRRYYYNKGHRWYHHPRFGNVVVRFAVDPFVIHHQQGDFYYSDGLYYRFYPEIGYVVVDVPESIYFECLPDNYARVSYNGNVYFTDGDLCFVHYQKGFRLIKAPSGIHFAIRF